MSEQTGATPEQIEAAVERWPNGQKHTKRDIVRQVVRDYAADLVPPGYRIVPADAVVIDRATAATAAEACLARGTEVLGEWETFEQARQCEQRSARYRAAAAALRGEG